MAYVVTEACIGCRYGECVAVCPQDAFREGPNFVAIDPAACANCGLCEMVCPVQAIVAARALSPDQRDFHALNALLAKEWPIAVRTLPLPDADALAFTKDKRALLHLPREPGGRRPPV